MAIINVTFPDGSIKEFSEGTNIGEVAKSISGRLAKEALAAEVNGKIVDLNYQLNEDAAVKILTFQDNQGKDVFRHSSAHLLAEAVLNLFPETKLGIGPAIEDGFYYDFDSEHTFTPEDLEKIEKEMMRLKKNRNLHVKS